MLLAVAIASFPPWGHQRGNAVTFVSYNLPSGSRLDFSQRITTSQPPGRVGASFLFRRFSDFKVRDAAPGLWFFVFSFSCTQLAFNYFAAVLRKLLLKDNLCESVRERTTESTVYFPDFGHVAGWIASKCIS